MNVDITNRIFFVAIFIIINSCTFERYLKNPYIIDYEDKDLSIKILVNKVKKIEDKYIKSYFYYGIMTSRLLSDKNPPQAIKVIYENEESDIYPDAIVSIIDFWDRNSWNEIGYRKNKVYIVLSNQSSNINWSLVKIKFY